MGKKRIIFGIILIILIILGMVCLSGKKYEDEAKGFIYKASKEDKTLYIVGHMWNPPSGMVSFTKDIKNIADESDILLVPMDKVKDSSYIFFNDKEDTKGKSDKLVIDALNEKEKESLRFISEKIDMDYDIFLQTTVDKALHILGSYISGYFTNKEEELDSLITKYFYEKNKKVYEFEGYEIQQEILERIINESKSGTEGNEEFLKKILVEFNDDFIISGNTYFKNQEKAYIKGDEEIFIDELIRLKNEEELLYNVGVFERNKIAFERIKKNLERGDKVLISVRAEQLFLEEGLLKMLDGEGYRIERL